MTRLFIAAVITLNLGVAGAVSSAIETPLTTLQKVAAAKRDADTFRLRVAIHDMQGATLAQPTLVARPNVETTVRTQGRAAGFALTASFEIPRDPKSYNAHSPCHIVNLKLVEIGSGPDAPQAIAAMMKLCGEAITMPISETRMITVDLRPAHEPVTLANL